jgi:hypothetical protein
MLTRQERDETIRHWGETQSPAVVLCKCAAGLAFVVAVALVGALIDPPSEQAAKTAAAMGPETQARVDKGVPRDRNESPQAAADPRSLPD